MKKLIWAMVVELMGCMGAFLTLVDIHEYFTDEKVEIGLFRLFIGCAILVLFVNFVWKTLVFQCKFHGNRIIKIRFGNILKRKDGTVLVPINDRLYSRRNIGRRNTGSMHDQLMDGRYGDAIRMIAQEYILSCTHQKDDTPVRAQTLVIMLRPQDVFKRALDIMTLCDEIETMVKVCGSCKIYR